MAIITRSVAEYKARVPPRSIERFPIMKQLSFEENPCTRDEANAHLMMLAPNGFIVLGPMERGPLGGWTNIRFTQLAITTWIAEHRTLHIAYATYQISKESNDG